MSPVVPVRIVVQIDPVLLGLVLALGLVLSALYAVLLSTEAGRRVCDRRTHWTVVGGHLVMALTMCFVSAPMAVLWLAWSVVHGAPLVIRSEVLRWRAEARREQAWEGAVRGVLGDEMGRRVLNRRKDMGLSQEALAQRASISRNYVSLIERGEARNVSLNIMGQLAIALETTPAWLMGQPSQDDILIPPALRKFGLEAGLSFETVDKLARIPRRGQEPQSVEQWRRLYDAIRPYLKETNRAEN